ncbi:MAG: biopolymer transporter ExbD [Nocardioides sp.]
MMEINTTPLIDVMLVLIIVLIMSIPIMTHATKLDMPQTNAPPPTTRPEVIQIDIDFDGTIVWNGTVVSGIPQLESFFRSERGQGSAAGNPPATRPPVALRNHGPRDGRGAAQSHEEDGFREHLGIPRLNGT